jgi:hypothetical protein
MKGSSRMDALRAMRERDYAKSQKLVARKEHARKMLEHLSKQAVARSDSAANRRKVKKRSRISRVD